jgi:preprotein translocase subunit YajC
MRELLGNLKKDDMVVTSGGIHGKITGLTDTIATLEIAPSVRIKVSRSQIAGMSDVYKRGEEKAD